MCPAGSPMADIPEEWREMNWVDEVKICSRQVESFSQILEQGRMEEIRNLGADLKRRLAGRIIWNVNSTAAGGGVAEMLHTILSYARGLGVDTRWLVIGGNNEFFRITKRIHNALHGESGDGSSLDDEARKVYEQVTTSNWNELKDYINTGDIVILHDPQTAGLIPCLTQRGISVIWRCHIGNDVKSEQGDLAWNFLAGIHLLQVLLSSGSPISRSLPSRLSDHRSVLPQEPGYGS